MTTWAATRYHFWDSLDARSFTTVYRPTIVLLLASLLGDASLSYAQPYKQLPPAGIAIEASVRESLRARVDELQSQIDELAVSQTPADLWRPDVEVLVRAVRLALEQNLFFRKSEPEIASKLLDEAERRLRAVKSGERGLQLLGLSAGPTDQPQLLVGGFRSRIDDSVQPYGLVVPAHYKPSGAAHRVDVWLHGRGDTKTEVPFLNERMTKVGRYAPENTFVLHPFGRHCNAFKFAGETDVYESLAHLGTLIPVDDRRVAIRGFSMGGAGCWHLAVHDPGRWFAANPGAGFVDTIVYQGWKNATPFPIDETRRKLLNWYDVLPWVTNLSNTNTIAYSGEVDKQKQAADRVAAAAKAADVNFSYVIGAGMGHKIDPASAAEIDSVINSWSQQTDETTRQRLDVVSFTLRYNRVDWLAVTGLEQHWSRGRAKARLTSDNAIEIKTDGITRLALDFRDSGWPHQPIAVELTIDDQQLTLDDWDPATGIQCELVRGDHWSQVENIDAAIRKRPGLQGPIDDAFCDRFIFVKSSRPAQHGVVQRWIDRELAYAQKRWSRLMRGEIRIVEDVDVTEDQIKSCHLICFGDFTSNRYLNGIAPHLPIEWTSKALTVGSLEIKPDTHVAAFCFPNPRNPDRYVVVNSGMTYREFSNVSNSRQIAMLPDWAVIDVCVDSDDIFPGKIVADGFFDEQWNLKQP
jgi:hypothetical protein